MSVQEVVQVVKTKGYGAGLKALKLMLVEADVENSLNSLKAQRKELTKDLREEKKRASAHFRSVLSTLLATSSIDLVDELKEANLELRTATSKLGKMIRKFNNENGYGALRERLEKVKAKKAQLIGEVVADAEVVKEVAENTKDFEV